MNNIFSAFTCANLGALPQKMQKPDFDIPWQKWELCLSMQNVCCVQVSHLKQEQWWLTWQASQIEYYVGGSSALEDQRMSVKKYFFLIVDK